MAETPPPPLESYGAKIAHHPFTLENKAIKVMLILIIAFLVFEPVASFASGDHARSIEAYGAHSEWLEHFLSELKHAARNGRRWRTDSQDVQHHIERIRFHAEQMIATSKTGDRATAEEQKEQVFSMLACALVQEYVTREAAESLVQVLQKYLPLTTSSLQHCGAMNHTGIHDPLTVGHGQSVHEDERRHRDIS